MHVLHRFTGATVLSALSTLIALGLGCSGAPHPEPIGPRSPESGTLAPKDEDGEVQAARGAKLYGQYCAECHGEKGAGSAKAPPVVGAEALPLDPRPLAKVRKGQFRTALDVAQFVVKNMPADAPGSLPESVYWDILAFDLKANGVTVTGKHIDASSAAELRLH
jgi:cytochrome c